MERNHKDMKKSIYILLAISLLSLQGCVDKQDIPDHAIAYITATAGHNTQGVVRFSQEKNGIRIRATITGLSEGDHGFHIHQFGDISRPDGKAAGGHFNPEHTEHAHPSASQRHIGDLGNIHADKDGYAYLEFVDTKLQFSGANSIIGRGLIIHENADDLSTQPTGAAGSRVGQAVIGITSK
jgi:superoxide dismutase, Cu-Zn family